MGYFIPALYTGVLFLSAGPLRARGLDATQETWIRGLPLRTGDYVLAKGLIHVLIAGLTWVTLMAGAGLIIRVSVAEVLGSLGNAALLAFVTHSFAYFWGTVMPIDDQESLQSLVSMTLFGVTTLGLYQVLSYVERAIQGSGGPLATGGGTALIFLVMAVLVEDRRRSRGQTLLD